MRVVANYLVVLLVTTMGSAIVQAQECAPCGDYQTVAEQRRKLEAAFRLSLTVPDCLGITNLGTCREIEVSLEEVTEAMDSIVTAERAERGARCLSCDPRPYLLSLAHGLNNLTYFLLDNGYGDPNSSHENRLARLAAWRDYRCPCSESDAVEAPETTADPEAHAREELTRKCGPNFANRRRGLRQVIRVPDDRPGCYQARTCRGIMAYKGFDVEPGFWTYDGEYWYVWAERMGTSGEWSECMPEEEEEGEDEAP